MTLHCVWNEASAYFIPKYLFLTLGKEHALGFFVTAVADGSPAQSAGLKVFVIYIYIHFYGLEVSWFHWTNVIIPTAHI